MPLDMSILMTVRECASSAGVSTMTIRRWMDDGRIKWMWKNRAERLAYRADFNAYLATLRNPQLQHTA